MFPSRYEHDEAQTLLRPIVLGAVDHTTEYLIQGTSVRLLNELVINLPGEEPTTDEKDINTADINNTTRLSNTVTPDANGDANPGRATIPAELAEERRLDTANKCMDANSSSTTKHNGSDRPGRPHTQKEASAAVLGYGAYGLVFSAIGAVRPIQNLKNSLKNSPTPKSVGTKERRSNDPSNHPGTSRSNNLLDTSVASNQSMSQRAREFAGEDGNHGTARADGSKRLGLSNTKLEQNPVSMQTNDSDSEFESLDSESPVDESDSSSSCSPRTRGDRLEPLAVKRMENIFESMIIARRALREIRILRHLQKHENIMRLVSVYFDGSAANFEHLYFVSKQSLSNLASVLRRKDLILTYDHRRFLLYQLLRGVKVGEILERNDIKLMI
jgi:hypothetical protein